MVIRVVDLDSDEICDHMIEMPNFERYMKEQMEGAAHIENIVYGGKRVIEYDTYKKYYELNEKLFSDLANEHLIRWPDLIPQFHVAQANQTVISHSLKISKIASDPQQDFWLRGYLILHLYSDYYELLWKEYGQLGKNIKPAKSGNQQSEESPFTKFRNKYPYTIPLFESCINKYRYTVSHAMYFVTDKKIMIYPKDSTSAEEVHAEKLVELFVDLFLLYNAFYVCKLRFENANFRIMADKLKNKSKDEAIRMEQIFGDFYLNQKTMTPDEFLEKYGKELENNK